jgi:NADPH2:quinone reductase
VPLADDGRLVIIAMLGGAKATVSLNEFLRRRLTLHRLRASPAPGGVQGAIARNLREGLAAHRIRGDQAGGLQDLSAPAEAAQAHALMESGTHIGKIDAHASLRSSLARQHAFVGGHDQR